MCALPKLAQIREILYKNMFTNKDLIPIKLVLDIYEEYYKDSLHGVDNYNIEL
jgi:hypothetical protein